jgi:mannose/fructose/N-acetylgalactosamine-specific phosphotransferase system component IIB
MNITLARIDDRLIHGQVTTVWSKVANAQRIIICNDDAITTRCVGLYSARPRLRA